MTEFLTAITAFPTLLFTIPVGLSVLYWLFVVIGAIDIDILNFDGVEGVFEGGLDGALDGVLDGGFDAALDGALDAGLDGALDAGLDGVADGATDAASDAAADVLAGRSLFFSMISGLRLTSVPVTVSMSLVALFGWVLCYLGMAWAPALVTGSPVLVATAVAFAAFIAGTGVTSVAVRPMSRFFETHDARRNRSLVGLSATVTTGRVDHKFGQAEVQDSGDNLLVQVRCDRDSGLERGDEALIVHFDRNREAFVVEPMPDVLASKADSPARTSQEAETRATDNESTPTGVKEGN